MSKKTILKRVAIIASAALTLAGVSTVAANAGAAIYPTVNVTGTAASTVAPAAVNVVGLNPTGTGTITAVIGTTSYINFTVDASNATKDTASASAADNIYNISSSGVGTINLPGTRAGVASPSATAGWQTGSATNATAYAGLTLGETNAKFGATAIQFSVNSTTAGTQTVTTAGGGAGTVTITINWLAAPTVAAAVNSSLFVTAASLSAQNLIDLGKSTSKAQDSSILSSITAIGQGKNYYVTVVARDTNGKPIGVKTGVGATLVIANSLSGMASSPTTSSASTDNGSSLNILQVTSALTTSTTVSGSSTVSVSFQDVNNSMTTLSVPLTITGPVASISLKNVTYAALSGGKSDASITGQPALPAAVASPAFTSFKTASAAASSIGTAGSNQGLLAVVAKDASGNIIDLSQSGAASITGFTIASDKATGSVVTSGNNSFGATAATNFGNSDITNIAGNAVLVACGAVRPEKLTITANGSSGATSGAAIASNPVSFYCSSAPTTIAVTPDSTTVNPSSVIRVTATVSDANSYPAPDGTIVNFAVSGGGTLAPQASNTINGVAGSSATTLVNFVTGVTSGTSSVTAFVGSIAGTSAIAIGSGVNAGDQASVATDAANAAQDAANAAAESADNATQAATDALTAVQSLASQVKKLIANVTKLSKLVASLSKKKK